MGTQDNTYVTKITQWEYKSLHITNNDCSIREGELNELGKRGWELCGIEKYNNDAILKRPCGAIFYELDPKQQREQVKTASNKNQTIKKVGFDY